MDLAVQILTHADSGSQLLLIPGPEKDSRVISLQAVVEVCLLLLKAWEVPGMNISQPIMRTKY